jgi:uncharacterized LabA/DUF88 family protein
MAADELRRQADDFIELRDIEHEIARPREHQHGSDEHAA